RLGVQAHEWPIVALSCQHRRIGSAGDLAQTDHPRVVVDRAGEVAHLQADAADSRQVRQAESLGPDAVGQLFVRHYVCPARRVASAPKAILNLFRLRSLMVSEWRLGERPQRSGAVWHSSEMTAESQEPRATSPF